MLLEHADGYDFRMVYYNSDGRESTMCGNGGRCITAFAKSLGMINNVASFLAIDGPHKAIIQDSGLISLHMQDVSEINIQDAHTILNTGSPHYVLRVADVKHTDVYHDGRHIRNLTEFQPDGINVNFVHMANEILHVRTYERGVEDETMSCGTGVTAAAIAATGTSIGEFNTEVDTPGGFLNVSFIKDTSLTAKDVILTGPAVFVFKGEIELLLK
jgi:diaminopimelate epimerase